jgi:large subunit ribosomal protein L9
MDVILLHDVDKLGHRGQIVTVANGYGRNYLLPQKIAVEATVQNRKWAEQQRVRFLKQTAKEKAEAQELAVLVEAVSLTFRRKAGEQGQLFGSVTAMDLADALHAQGFKIDRRKIQLDQPIKLLGEYSIPVKLHREVIAHFKVKVEGEAEAPAAAEASKESPKEQPPASPAPAE